MPVSGLRNVAVVLRPDAVRARLLKLEEIISRLEELRRSGAPPRDDFRAEWVTERGLQLGAEVLLDIGNHILSAHFGVSAQDQEDVIAQLGRCGVIDQDLRERLKGLGGFRNILVHDYLRLDPSRVGAVLSRAPRDFSDFAAAVRGWLETLPAQ
jgi:uncharacterized protein YutE (UPF0331/DUF86 family)